MYFLTKLGYSLIASEMEQKMTPTFLRVSLKVVAMEMLWKTQLTAKLVSLLKLQQISRIFLNIICMKMVEYPRTIVCMNIVEQSRTIMCMNMVEQSRTISVCIR